MKYYAGIGARKTPKIILAYIEQIAEELAKRNYILRSGGAYGADTAFEVGCDKANGKKEIYLPWKDFNNNKSELYDLPNKQDALQIASKFHPKIEVLSHAVKTMHSRNSYQVLGGDLNSPAAFIVCWTDGTGGTMQAIRAAKHYNIPIFNLKLEKNLNQIDPIIFVEHIEQTISVV